MKEMRDLDKKVVLSQIEKVRNTFKRDYSNEAKLTLLENTINIVDKNRATLGKVKNMSSLEKNRIALNLISSLKHTDQNYNNDQRMNIAKNMKHQQDISDIKYNRKFGGVGDHEYQSHQPAMHRHQNSGVTFVNFGTSKTNNRLQGNSQILQMMRDSQNKAQRSRKVSFVENIDIDKHEYTGNNFNYNSASTTMESQQPKKNFEKMIENSAMNKFQESMERDKQSYDKQVKSMRRNVSIDILKQKSNNSDDPMTHFGIMTLNHHIPYKKPILKTMPVFVNARGVMQDLEHNFGGLYFIKNNQSKEQDESAQKTKKTVNLNITNTQFIKSNMRRIQSAKPKRFKNLLHSKISSPSRSRPLSPGYASHALVSVNYSRNFNNSGAIFQNSELKQSLQKEF
eukprot:403355874